MYAQLGTFAAKTKTARESAEAKFKIVQSSCKAQAKLSKTDPKHEEAKKLLSTSREALER